MPHYESSAEPVRILFLCLGNICRSPLAEGVFQSLVEKEGLQHRIEVDSAGTGGWHVGQPPDKRMQATAKSYDLDISRLRGRQLSTADLVGETAYDLILAMDSENHRDALSLASRADAGRVRLFRDFDPEPDGGGVPDPYYGGEDGFHHVYRIVERTARNLLEHVKREYDLAPA